MSRRDEQDEECTFASALSRQRRRRHRRLCLRRTAALLLSLAHDSASESSVTDRAWGSESEERGSDSRSVSDSRSCDSAHDRGDAEAMCREDTRRGGVMYPYEEDEEEFSSQNHSRSNSRSSNNSDSSIDAHHDCANVGIGVPRRSFFYSRRKRTAVTVVDDDATDTDGSMPSGDTDVDDAPHPTARTLDASDVARACDDHDQTDGHTYTCDDSLSCGGPPPRPSRDTCRVPSLYGVTCEVDGAHDRANDVPAGVVCAVHEHIPARYGASQVTFGRSTASTPQCNSSCDTRYVLWHGGVVCANLPPQATNSFALFRYDGSAHASQLPSSFSFSPSSSSYPSPSGARVRWSALSRGSHAQLAAMHRIWCASASSPIHRVLQHRRAHTSHSRRLDTDAELPPALRHSFFAPEEPEEDETGDADGEEQGEAEPSLRAARGSRPPVPPRVGHCTAALPLCTDLAIRWLAGSPFQATRLRAQLERVARMHTVTHDSPADMTPINDDTHSAPVWDHVTLHLSLLLGGTRLDAPDTSHGPTDASLQRWTSRYALPSTCGAMAGYVRLPALREVMAALAFTSSPAHPRGPLAGAMPALCVTAVYHADGTRGEAQTVTSTMSNEAVRACATEDVWDAWTIPLPIATTASTSSSAATPPALFATLTHWPKEDAEETEACANNAEDWQRRTRPCAAQRHTVRWLHVGGVGSWDEVGSGTGHSAMRRKADGERLAASARMTETAALGRPALSLHRIQLDLRSWSLSYHPWRTHGVRPMARCGHSATLYAQVIYLFGGVAAAGEGGGVSGGCCLADLHLLDTRTRVWREVYIPLPMAVPARAFHCAAVIHRARGVRGRGRRRCPLLWSRTHACRRRPSRCAGCHRPSRLTRRRCRH